METLDLLVMISIILFATQLLTLLYVLNLRSRLAEMTAKFGVLAHNLATLTKAISPTQSSIKQRFKNPVGAKPIVDKPKVDQPHVGQGIPRQSEGEAAAGRIGQTARRWSGGKDSDARNSRLQQGDATPGSPIGAEPGHRADEVQPGRVQPEEAAGVPSSEEGSR